MLNSVKHNGNSRLAYKIVVASRRQDFRHFLQYVLSSKPEFDVIGEACNIDEAFRVAEDKKPGLLILDLDLKHDPEILKNVRQKYPWLKIILTSYYDFSKYSKLPCEDHTCVFIPKTRLSIKSIMDIMKAPG